MEEPVARRVEEDLETRKDEMELGALEGVAGAKCIVEKQLLKEPERLRQAGLAAPNAGEEGERAKRGALGRRWNKVTEKRRSTSKLAEQQVRMLTDKDSGGKDDITTRTTMSTKRTKYSLGQGEVQAQTAFLLKTQHLKKKENSYNDLPFWDWLISLNVMASRIIHGIAHGRLIFLFKAE